MASLQWLAKWFSPKELEEIEASEPVLIALASEKLWNDINVICDEMNIATKKRPYLKGYLIKKASSLYQNESNKTDDSNQTTRPQKVEPKTEIKNENNNDVDRDNHGDKGDHRVVSDVNDDGDDHSDTNDDNATAVTHVADDDDDDEDSDEAMNEQFETYYKENGLKYQEIQVFTNSEKKEYLKCISMNQCCVIKEFELLQNCMDDWSVEYLNKKVGNQSMNVLVSNSRNFVNVNWNNKTNNNSNSNNNKMKSIPMELSQMSLSQFVKNVNISRKNLNKYPYSHASIVHENGGGNKNKNKNKNKKENSAYYFVETSLGKEKKLKNDLLKWDWTEYLNIAKECKWGALSHNTLMIGMKGNLKSLHYNDYHSIFIQINGYKEFILFDKCVSSHLYAFPCGHVCQQQSMVNVEFISSDVNNKDYFQKKFGVSNDALNANVYRIVLQPGDALFIPSQWWYESVDLDDFAMSVCVGSLNGMNVLCNDDDDDEKKKNGNEVYINIARNLEKLILDKYGESVSMKIWSSFCNNDIQYIEHRRDILELLIDLDVFTNENEIETFINELTIGRYNIPINKLLNKKLLYKCVSK